MDLLPEIERNVAAALAKDVGDGDLTAPLTPADRSARAVVLCRRQAVLCGQPWFDACVRKLDPRATVTWLAADGTHVPANTRVCETQGGRGRLLDGGALGAQFPAAPHRGRVGSAPLRGRRRRHAREDRGHPQDAAGAARSRRSTRSHGGGDNHRIGLYDAC